MKNNIIYDVFISHTKTDGVQALDLASRLREKGIKVWFDKWNIPPGANIVIDINKGLEQSRSLIVCLSPKAMDSDWVKLEASTAFFSKRNKIIIPVVIKECSIPPLLTPYRKISYRSNRIAAVDEIAKALRNDICADNHTKNTGHGLELLKNIKNLTNESFIDRIVQPLLDKLKYHIVKKYSTQHFLASHIESFGKNILCFVYIANINYNEESIEKLGKQLKVMVNEKITDLNSDGRAVVDRILIFSQYEMGKSYIRLKNDNSSVFSDRRVDFIDAIKLSELIPYQLDTIVEELSLESQYTFRLLVKLNTISEISIAMGLKEEIKFDDIYVEVSVISGRNQLEILLNCPTKKSSNVIRKATKNNIKQLKTLLLQYKTRAIILNGSPEPTKRSKTQINKLKKEIKEKIFSDVANERKTLDQELVIELNIAPVINELNKSAVSRLESLATAIRDGSNKQITKSIKECIDVSKKFNTIISNNIISKECKWIADSISKTKYEFPKVTPTQLLDITLPVFITGKPGIGKTTILKKLAILSSRSNSRTLTVFISLCDFQDGGTDINNEVSIEGLLKFTNSISRISPDFNSLLQSVKSGRVLLLLDGLDEMGDNAKTMLDALRSYCRQNKKARIFVTCRDTSGFEWKEACAVDLPEFDRYQVTAFVKNWFGAEHDNASSLLSWINKNRAVRKVIKTPLYAAVLCRIYSSGAEMPRSEVGLYDSRLDLLLGRWEKAKGIQPMPQNTIDSIYDFLIEFAFELHKSKKRFFSKQMLHDALKEFNYFPPVLIDCESCESELRKRAIIEFDIYANRYSFGHLTFQEHLAAIWLARHNDMSFIVKIVADKYWSRTIEFYAMIIKDIRVLIDNTIDEGSNKYDMRIRMLHLLKFATRTPNNFVKRCN